MNNLLKTLLYFSPLFISCNFSNSAKHDLVFCKKFSFETCQGNLFFDTTKNNRYKFNNSDKYWSVKKHSDSTYEICAFYIDKKNTHWAMDISNCFNASIKPNRKLYFNEGNDEFFGYLKRTIYIAKNIDIDFFEYENASRKLPGYYLISYMGSLNRIKLQGELRLLIPDTILFKKALDDYDFFQNFIIPKLRRVDSTGTEQSHTNSSLQKN